ncbi:hypothetical protein Cni_G12127 [Canna indica]|uniref:Uncharacterized protein n=1 Tax=Canna indica TaxID=4628 RepID=A0AAQ3KBB9_9LILI|nr:hypothetical protein Cni_G12127 [Canna indica]
MNRRIQSLNPKASPSQIEERLHRFLRPGALARLRDSRINSARSLRSVAIPRFTPPSSPSPVPPSPAADQIDRLTPFFSSRVHGPQFVQRKKLAAAKSFFFAPSSPELPDAFLDAFGVDLVAAH